MAFNDSNLEEALSLLGERLRMKDAFPVRLVVCGGSALIAMTQPLLIHPQMNWRVQPGGV